MSNMKRLFTFAAAISLVLTTFALAAGEKFRADGTIQRISSDMVLVRTKVADIEIARNAQTKVTGDLRRGAPVTVFYSKVGGTMTASEIVMGGAPGKAK